MPKVLIVGGDHLIAQMFLKRGWEIVTSSGPEPDLYQFTGGEDVTPALYYEEKHPATYNNPTRDAYEANIFYKTQLKGIAMAGICRGAQFLNVMSGGKMWQDVDGHAIRGTHEAFDRETGVTFEVTSTHHQMMRPAMDKCSMLLSCDPPLSTYRQTGKGTVMTGDVEDTESVFYYNTKALCYQPHPEYVSVDHPCQDLYFSYLDKHLGLKA